MLASQGDRGNVVSIADDWSKESCAHRLLPEAWMWRRSVFEDSREGRRALAKVFCELGMADEMLSVLHKETDCKLDSTHDQRETRLPHDDNPPRPNDHGGRTEDCKSDAIRMNVFH